MNTPLRAALLFGLALHTTAAFAQPKSKTVPSLAKPVKVNASLSDLKGGLLVAPATGGFTARVGLRKDVLHVGLEIPADEAPEGAEQAELSLHFPNAGPTARGHVWRLGPGGLLPPDATLPAHAHKLTQAAVDSGEETLRMELAIPARALPRFHAGEPLVFDLCIKVGEKSNCAGGSMGEPLRLPEDFRKQLKLKLPEDVVGVEGRASGWVGYAHLHYPTWVASDGPVTPPGLREMVGEGRLVDPREAGINLPDALLLPDKRTILSVLTGKNPYEKQGECDGDLELRFALYLVQGRTASRVLEWPAATCALGRAVAFELEEDGELNIGYTNGASVTFHWVKDHFERTEIGTR